MLLKCSICFFQCVCLSKYMIMMMLRHWSVARVRGYSGEQNIKYIKRLTSAYYLLVKIHPALEHERQGQPVAFVSFGNSDQIGRTTLLNSWWYGVRGQSVKSKALSPREIGHIGVIITVPDDFLNPLGFASDPSSPIPLKMAPAFLRYRTSCA